MSSELTVDIERDARAPSRARRALQQLQGVVDDDLMPDLALLVSELVTNGVKYGEGGPLTLKLEPDGRRRMRVEVIDDGGGFVPVRRNRRSTEVGGWGLELVETLADRWGVYEGSTHVWFELDRG